MTQVDSALEKVDNPDWNWECRKTYEMEGKPAQEQIKAFEEAKECLKYIVNSGLCPPSA